VACAVVGLGALAGNAGAVDISASYTDPSGDSAAGPDIVEVTLTSVGGTLTVEIDIGNRAALLPGPGDEVALYLNTDRNLSTGSFFGVDYLIQAFSTGLRMQRWTGSSYAVYAPASFSGSFGNGVLRASVHLDEIGSPEVFDHFAGSLRDFVFTDIAPDPGLGMFVFDMRDADGDSVVDSQDACPDVPAGRYDTNDNGCPGPFSRVPRPGFAYRWVAAAGGATLTKATLDPVPNGAKVVARSASIRQVLTKKPGRPVTLSRFLGHFLGFGDVITVTITKGGWIGWVGKYRLTTGRELKRFSEKCVPPGGGTPRACSSIDPGR
jgi:hypothetical protein